MDDRESRELIVDEIRRGPKEKWFYSKEFAEIICQKISEGMSLEDVCLEEGIPSRWVISKWRLENPEFNEMIKIARQIRAEYYHDEAIKVARKKKTRNEVPGAVLEVATLRWAAQVNDPGTFGNKVKVESEQTQKVQFIIETGIRRPGDPGYIIDETAKLKEVKKVDLE